MSTGEGAKQKGTALASCEEHGGSQALGSNSYVFMLSAGGVSPPPSVLGAHVREEHSPPLAAAPLRKSTVTCGHRIKAVYSTFYSGNKGLAS